MKCEIRSENEAFIRNGLERSFGRNPCRWEDRGKLYLDWAFHSKLGCPRMVSNRRSGRGRNPTSLDFLTGCFDNAPQVRRPGQA